MLPDFPADQQTPEFIQQTLAELRLAILQAEQRSESLQAGLRTLESQRQALELRRIETQTQLAMLQERSRQTAANLSVMLTGSGFADGESLAAARLEPVDLARLAQDIADYDTEARDIELQLRACEDSLQGRWLDDESWGRAEAEAKSAEEMLSQARLGDDRTRHKLDDMLKSQAIRQEKESEHAAATARRGRISQIEALVRGNAFVEYVAEERLRAIVAEATEYLQTMTRYRYALELDTERSFVVRDQLNGGEVRLAGSLSGGETFMASLALALALSSQIQIRGQSRLEFFFLDEGFGSLDNDLLDTVMDSLERISSPQRLIGLISHVPELRNRIGTRLVIEPAGTRSGSKISLEHG